MKMSKKKNIYRKVIYENNERIAEQRGIVGYRMLKVSDDLYLRLAITKKRGPRGGRSIVVSKIERIGTSPRGK
mgnify:CR=1 FL=1